MPEGIETHIRGDQVTVMVLDKSRRGKVAHALLAAGGPELVSTVTTAHGLGYTTTLEVARKAGIVDDPAPTEQAEPVPPPRRRAPRRRTKAADGAAT
jgi:hypothetical protein